MDTKSRRLYWLTITSEILFIFATNIKKINIFKCKYNSISKLKLFKKIKREKRKCKDMNRLKYEIMDTFIRGDQGEAFEQ